MSYVNTDWVECLNKWLNQWRRREPFYIIGKVNWCSHYVKQKAKNRVAIWRSNPTPRCVWDKTTIQKATCTPVFMAALFTIVKTGKPHCPLPVEWIMEMWHIYSMEYCSAIKRNEIMPLAATWMDLVTVILREANQEKTNIIRYHWYVGYKIRHKWTYLWNRNRRTDIERRLVTKVGIEREMDWELGISRCKLFYISWINNEVLLYSTRNHIQCPVRNHNGKNMKKIVYIHIYI